MKDEILEKLYHRIDNILLLATSVESDEIDKEKIIVGLMEIIPFDDASREKVKKELKKLGDEEQIKTLLRKVVEDVHGSREKQLSEKVARQVEKYAYLGSIDHLWVDHIDHIDGLREGVRLRGYAQRDPVAEFKNEAYQLFEGLLDRIDEELSRRIFRIGVAHRRPEIPLDQVRTNIDQLDQMGLAGEADIAAQAGEPAFAEFSSGKPVSAGSSNQRTNQVVNKQSGKKIGRNDPCWCGSGKKFKKCHYPQTG